MKKLFVIMLAVITVSAASAEGWNAGIRLGSGFQAQSAFSVCKSGAIEARFGMTWYYGTPISADFQALYYFTDLFKTREGLFLDAGVGFALGGRPGVEIDDIELPGITIPGASTPGSMYYGVAPSVKFGYKFSNVPIKLAVDWSPVIGGVSNGGGYFTRGLANVGLSCVYCF